MQRLDVCIKVFTWRGSECVPKVVRVIAFVVVAHTRVLVDDCRGFINVLWSNSCSDER